MYNVSYPVKYHHVPVRYYYATFVVCVAASALMTFIRFIVPDDIHPTVMIVPFCLPLTAIHGFALHFWLFCNFAISVFVLKVFTRKPWKPSIGFLNLSP
uniref:Uncharacterized protein n=1 Tax=Caenorhabditis japonica TaxID=281687 RepID=A0A8R1I079_CAEJA